MMVQYCHTFQYQYRVINHFLINRMQGMTLEEQRPQGSKDFLSKQVNTAMGMNIALREPHLLSVKISQLLLIRYSQCYDDTTGECGHCHSSRVHFHLRSIRVPDKFSRYGANQEFQRVNFQCSHQIIINFLLICWVMSLTLSGF